MTFSGNSEAKSCKTYPQDAAAKYKQNTAQEQKKKNF